MATNKKSKTYQRFLTRMESLAKTDEGKVLYDAFRNGQTTYLRLDRIESSSFDASWIKMIEDCLFDLGEIVKNPRLSTKTVSSIVPVELARKTNAESVQHLASHTQYIKEVDDYGNVIPKKILNIGHEDDLHTYENRFIATLIRRLVLFIEKRYEFVMRFAPLHNREVLRLKHKTLINGIEVEIESNVKVTSPKLDTDAQLTSRYAEKIAEIREYVLYYYSSPFMKQMKTEKNVRNPILQTNIIRKNPLYHHCYELYRFIESYESLGVDYKVQEDYSIFSDEEMANLDYALMAAYLSLDGQEHSFLTKRKEKTYKPKIRTSLDDEAFVYGPLTNGPIEFVRVDEDYRKYQESKIRKDLPLHPTKKEKEYFAEEYALKKEIKQEGIEQEKLLKRKKKEANAFEKEIQKILQERESARLELLRLEQEAINAEDYARLERIREEIRKQALLDKEEAKKRDLEEAKRIEEEKKAAEEARLEAEKQAEQARLEAERKALEAEEKAREEEERKAEEERRASEEARIAEEQDRLALETASLLSNALLAGRAEQNRLEEQAKAISLEEERQKEAKRIEEEKKAAEEARLKAEKKAEKARLEAERKALEAEEKARKEEEKKAEEERKALEAKRIEEEQKILEARLPQEEPASEEPIEEAIVQTKPKETLPEPPVGEPGFFNKLLKKHRVKIPGAFIVKTPYGYFVNEGVYSQQKNDSYIFDDFNLANDVKAELGGKVIKL